MNSECPKKTVWHKNKEETNLKLLLPSTAIVSAKAQLELSWYHFSLSSRQPNHPATRPAIRESNIWLELNLFIIVNRRAGLPFVKLIRLGHRRVSSCNICCTFPRISSDLQIENGPPPISCRMCCQKICSALALGLAAYFKLKNITNW